MIYYWLTLIYCCMSTYLIISINASIDLSNLDVNDLKNQLPGNFPKVNISVDQAKDLIKKKCNDILGEEKGTEVYHDIEMGAITLVECVGNILNYTAIQKEITEASPKGELDTVFNKYCAKQPDLIQCIDHFSDNVTPCLDREEQDSQTVLMRMIHKLFDFICNKGGDHIALFIAEKGPECLQSQSDAIQNCLNRTFSSYVPADTLDNIKSLPKLVLNKEQCDDIFNLEECIVKKLETCDEITPANIIESMFRFMKNETICRNVGRPLHLVAPNNAITLIFHPMAITLNIGTILYSLYISFK